jgi:hypothetical protein
VTVANVAGARRVVVTGLLVLASIAGSPHAAWGVEEEDPPATALRVGLDRLLAEHALLSMEVVRSAIADAPDFDAAAGVLEENTSEIIAAIEDVYGPEAGAAFGEQWRNHIGYLVDYARATAEGDSEASALASRQLDRYVSDFSELLAGAMPVLPAETVEHLIDEHVRQLEHVAAFDHADFGHAYPAIRDTYRHMFDIGDGLVIGIVSAFPERFTGRELAFSPATDLRITLDRLLGEHTYLAALAMRATLNEAPDRVNAAEALAGNSADLAAAIAGIYGQAAGDAFGALWESHVTSYFAYVAGLADDDDAAVADALDQLRDYRRDFSSFIANANPFVPDAALEGLLEAHTDHLVRQADAYAAEDYDASHRLAREAYAHTAELSASLAAAIQDQFPQRFPDAAMTAPAGSWPIAAAGALGALGLLTVLVVRSRRARVGGGSVSA